MRIKNLRRVSVLFLITFWAVSSNIMASRFDNIIEKANQFYKNEQYQQAIDEYQKILEQGYESAEVYYNMGNAYYKLGKLGYAVLYYEKALKLNPDDEDTRYNLKIARAHTIDKIKEVPQIFLVRWWNALLATFTLKNWATITSVTFLILMVMVGLYFLSGNISIRKISFVAGTVLLFLFVFFSTLLFLKYQRETQTHFGVIVTNVVAVKQSPDEKAPDAFIVHEGLKIRIEDTLDNWVKVRLPDGKVGWLPKGNFEII
jgi:hypothetical protein